MSRWILIYALPFTMSVWSEANKITLNGDNQSVFFCRQFREGGMPGLNELASPNFPSKYPPNVDCVRRIQAPQHYHIILHFKSVFEIEAAYEESMGTPLAATSNCPHDYLEIRDGRYSFSPLLARLCGMRPPGGEIRTQSDFLWMHFHSDNLLEYRGFSAIYEFLRMPNDNASSVRDTGGRDSSSSEIEDLDKECRFHFLNHLDGEITSAVMREFYMKYRGAHSSLNCIWEIQVPQWLSAAIFIEEFKLASPNQCRENFFEVYAGKIARNPLKRYCGVTTTHLYTGQSTVFLRFFAQSAAQVHASFAKITFSTYVARKNCSAEKQDLFACGDDEICIPRRLVCNSRYNCLYRQDERNCGKDGSVLNTLLFSNYSPLLVMLFIGTLMVLVLCAWYRPFYPNQTTEVDLKQLSYHKTGPPTLPQTANSPRENGSLSINMFVRNLPNYHHHLDL